MPNPFVFIVGCPRSGTTLLERMANAHPLLAIVHETHWITRFYKKRIGLNRDGHVTPELITRLKETRRFSHFNIPPEELDRMAPGDRRTSYSDFVAGLYDRYGEQEGKNLVGDKTTGGYLRNLGILHVLWPEAKFVHAIRDGRDVCLSMLSWPKAHRAAGRLPMWEENPVATTALWWRWHVQCGMKDGRRLDPALYHELRFETLVKEPDACCAAFCSFLGIPFDEAMLGFNEGRVQTGAPELSPNQAWLPPTPGLRDWRVQMDAADVELFEALAGDALSELGYERAFPQISDEVETRAATLRQTWEVGQVAR